MRELYDIGISEDTLKSMLEQEPNIIDLTGEEIIEKIILLKKINCSDNQIIDIISSNPYYLNRSNGEIINLFNILNMHGFKTLNILFDSNPFILSLEPFEIENYINKRVKKGEKVEIIIDDLESNTLLFNEM